MKFMNTLIIGAGAIGIAAGTALQAAGASVTFLARGETKTAMEQVASTAPVCWAKPIASLINFPSRTPTTG